MENLTRPARLASESITFFSCAVHWIGVFRGVAFYERRRIVEHIRDYGTRKQSEVEACGYRENREEKAPSERGFAIGGLPKSRYVP